MEHGVRKIIHKAYLVGMRFENLEPELFKQILGLKKTKVYDKIF
jgi:hypothetical protein